MIPDPKLLHISV